MKKLTMLTILYFVLIAGCGQKTEEKIETEVNKDIKPTKRVGMVIGLKPDQVEEYKELHSDENEGVRDLLNKYNMHNFSIYLHQFDDGKYYLFGYYEYTGEDYEADMAALAEEERNIEWLKTTDPMQIPFEGENSWTQMERVYFNK